MNSRRERINSYRIIIIYHSHCATIDIVNINMKILMITLNFYLEIKEKTKFTQIYRQPV